MKRKITRQLIDWKNSVNRMPLILNGARQVGKTYSIQEFGKLYYKNVVYVNFETNLIINEYFNNDIRPEKIIQYLEIETNTPIYPNETLIVFDEIQTCNRALTSLKSFQELTPQYHIVAAGSLLGVAINRDKFSFPVGKVTELQLFPMDFEEFLWSLGKENLSQLIREHYQRMEALPVSIHTQAIELYKQYLVVGGMPAVVKHFSETNSFLEIFDIQANIQNNYIADMAKYALNPTSVKIRASYNSIPVQLAKENKKFQYKIAQKGGTASIFGEAIEWLISAGIVLRCSKIDQGMMPLNAYVDVSDFKLYLSDVGLLTQKSGIAPQIVLSEMEIDNGFIGALTENYVAQQLVSNKLSIFYWKNDNTAEVDFVLQIGINIIPVEVKKGTRNRSISMNIFSKKYNSAYSIRISKKNFGFENNIKSIPLYAVYCLENSL